MYENSVYDKASLIFPIIQPLPEALNDARLREDVLSQINEDPYSRSTFRGMTPQDQEALLGFCVGNRGLKITYDPFFKYIFDSDMHPGRLDMFLSAILGQRVRVKQVLPRESRQLINEGSLIILDILVELSNKSYINVEMQRIGYGFPSERSFCYGAELLVKQYDILREKHGKQFSYEKLRPVYVIVLMEESPGLFHKKGNYIHRSEMIFDTGIKMNNLLNFIYISLDIFRENIHNKKHKKLTKQDAWLYFLSSDDPQDILHLIEQYPMFRELYQDIINFRYHPKEMMNMYSEALAVLDKNTELYMIDRLEKNIKKKDNIIAKKEAVISKKDAEISEKDAEISEKEAEISEKEAEISEKDAALSEKNAEIERLRAKLAQYENSAPK